MAHSGADPLLEGRGPMLSGITNELTHLVARHYGKGPTQAYSSLSSDLLTTVMRGSLTTVERTLRDNGRASEVHALRRSFQDVMRPRFIAVVEAATGRAVEAHLSQVSLEPEVEVELFFLGPVPSAEPQGA